MSYFSAGHQNPVAYAPSMNSKKDAPTRRGPGQPMIGETRKSTLLSIRLEVSERQDLGDAAAASGYKKTSTWARDVLVRAARRKLKR
jgi:hypothetical protein